MDTFIGEVLHIFCFSSFWRLSLPAFFPTFSMIISILSVFFFPDSLPVYFIRTPSRNFSLGAQHLIHQDQSTVCSSKLLLKGQRGALLILLSPKEKADSGKLEREKSGLEGWQLALTKWRGEAKVLPSHLTVCWRQAALSAQRTQVTQGLACTELENV